MKIQCESLKAQSIVVGLLKPFVAVSIPVVASVASVSAALVSAVSPEPMSVPVKVVKAPKVSGASGVFQLVQYLGQTLYKCQY